MNGPQKAQGLQAASPTELRPAISESAQLYLFPHKLSTHIHTHSHRPSPPGLRLSSYFLKRALFLIFEVLLPVYRAQPLAVALRPEPGRNCSAARDSKGASLPKVQKSSIPTPSLTTSQTPRRPGTEPHPE